MGWTEGASKTHGERGARAYNGDLGAEPPAGSRGIHPGQGSENCRGGRRVGGLNPPVILSTPQLMHNLLPAMTNINKCK